MHSAHTAKVALQERKDSLGRYALILLLAALIIVCFIPGRKLFFRNDEWGYVSMIVQVLKGQLSLPIFLFNYRQRHFVPATWVIYFLKFVIFRGDFLYHYWLSLFFHIGNTVLLYFAGWKISCNRHVAFIGAVLFGCCAIGADTVFWPATFHYIVSATLMLITFICHPALHECSARQQPFSTLCFYFTLAFAPFVLEIGYITIAIAICIYLLKPGSTRKPLAILTLLLLLHLMARIGLVAFLNMRMGAKSLTGFLYLTGLRHMPYNIASATAKLFLGLTGAAFKIKITDTLYVLDVQWWELQSWIAFLSLALCVWLGVDFLRDQQIKKSLKLTYGVFILIVLAFPFLTSLGLHPSNPSIDLIHQMPRYYYLPACLAALILAQLLRRTPKFLWISILAFVIFAQTSFIHAQIRALRPYTDAIKEAVRVYKATGRLPEKNTAEEGNGIDFRRLDWSLDENSARAFLQLGKNNL